LIESAIKGENARAKQRGQEKYPSLFLKVRYPLERQMPHKVAESERWSGEVKEAEMAPKGPVRCLQQAIERLGPFRHKMQADADERGPQDEMGFSTSHELAVERVVKLAFDYNRQSKQNANAPRIKDVIDRITKLESLAGELARHIEGLDAMSRFYMNTGGSGIVGFGEVGLINLMDDAECSPKPAPEVGHTASEWVSKLDALSAYASLCLKNFLECKGIESIDRADLGGSTNLLKEMVGSPEWGLVLGGWYLYDLFKPGTATMTDGGPFHLFLMDVFELATGRDPEESKLVPLIKQIVKAGRRSKEIANRQRVLSQELDALEDEDFRYRDPDRAAEIQTELLYLVGQRILHAPSLEPPSTRKRRGNEPPPKA
jgi:hypothetical protein